MRKVHTSVKFCGKDVRIADNVVIKHPELVGIGSHVAIDDFTVITTAADIGDYVHIASHCAITGGPESKFIMNDFSGLSTGCRMICGSDDYLGSGLTNPTIPAKYRATVKFGMIELRRHVILGANCVVLPDNQICEGVAVGACSLVTGTLNPWGVYFGVPAKYVRERKADRIISLEAALRAEEISQWLKSES